MEMATTLQLTERQVRTFFVNHRIKVGLQHPQLKRQWQALAQSKAQNLAYTNG
jgi:hypothetical protein